MEKYRNQNRVDNILNKLSLFERNAPLRILTEYDVVGGCFCVRLRGTKTFKTFYSDCTNDSVITEIQEWLYQYYPRYTIQIKKHSNYNYNEIVNNLYEERQLNPVDALHRKKTIKKEKIYIIEKVYGRGRNSKGVSCFLVVSGEEKSLRIPGSLKYNSMITMTAFMNKVRELYNNNENEKLKDFVLQNSTFYKKIKDKDNAGKVFRENKTF